MKNERTERRSIRKRWIGLLVLVGAAAYASVALATPGQGSSAQILAVGQLKGDLAFNTGLVSQANGLTWNGKQYAAEQLPEFLGRLRSDGVTSLGEWLNLHPAVAARFGMVPVGGAALAGDRHPAGHVRAWRLNGWHNHPGYVMVTVIAGQVVRYETDCTATTFSTGQSFYETPAKTLNVKNEGTTDAVTMVTLVVPGGTPTAGIRLDKAQPPGCTK